MWNGVFQLGWFSIPITIFAALGVINAFNMMDGIDGLSSVIFIIAGSAMAWLALRAGHVFNAGILMIAVASALGFFLLNARLPWNKRARVFWVTPDQYSWASFLPGNSSIWAMVMTVLLHP